MSNQKKFELTSEAAALLGRKAVNNTIRSVGATGGGTAGALAGGASGAAIGALLGPPGAGIGFLIGFTAGFLGGATGGWVTANKCIKIMKEHSDEK